MRSGGAQRALQRALEREAKAAALINGVNFVSRRDERAHPGHKGVGRETTRAARRGVIVLLHGHVKGGVNIKTDLDHGAQPLSLNTGSLG
jgi:hypothetical protein